MKVTVSGTDYRLNFTHFHVGPKAGIHNRTRGITVCTVERKIKGVTHEGWAVISPGEAVCGRKDSYHKETGRQFSLIRALRNKAVSKEVKGRLLDAYVKSAKNGRELCHDLRHRGFSNLYQAVFWDEARIKHPMSSAA